MTLHKAELVCEAIVGFDLETAKTMNDVKRGILGMLHVVVANLELYRPFLPDHLFAAKENRLSVSSEGYDDDRTVDLQEGIPNSASLPLRYACMPERMWLRGLGGCLDFPRPGSFLPYVAGICHDPRPHRKKNK